MPQEKWAFTLNEEYWGNDTYNSKEEAISAAKAFYDNGEKQCYIGRLSQDKLQLYVDADAVLENISQYMYDTAGEVAEDYLQKIPAEQEEILSTRLTEVVRQWATEFKHHPDFYLVETVETLNLRGDSHEG